MATASAHITLAANLLLSKLLRNKIGCTMIPVQPILLRDNYFSN